MSLINEIKTDFQAVATPRWVPGVLLKPYRTWTLFSVILGFFMLRLVLIVLYTVVMIPTSLLMRIFGQYPMRRKPTASYWISKHE